MDRLRPRDGRARARETGGEPIRILILSHLYPSAVSFSAGVFVHDQARALAALGHDVRVVSPVGWAPPFLRRWRAHRRVPGVDLVEGIPVLHPRKLSLPGARLGHRNAAAMYWAVRGPLRAIHRRWPFDLIHAHMLVPDGWAGARVARGLDLPVVATAHRADVLDLPARGPEERRVVSEAVEEIDQICAVSAAVGTAAAELAPPRRPIEIVPNGADTRIFSPRPAGEARARLGLPGEGPLVSYVGQLTVRKGVDTLIEALGLLARRPGGAPLLAMGGDGPLRGELERSAARLGVSERVRFLGPLAHADVAWLMAAGDLFVLPSLSEGLPTVVCEAMNCGRPVVATAVDGTPEIVRDGSTGLLVAPSDAPALAGALARVLDDPETARRMGEEALRVGRERYTWAANARRMVEIYESLRR